ncbi:MAG TPA: site-specific integrase [Pyrinomonadaceae bacterium]|jgi:integrase
MVVHQRGTKKGSWYVHLQINGKRIRKVIKEARTRREAEKAERVILAELFENRWGIGGQKNFTDFVENSYKPYAREHKKGYYVELSALKVLIKRFGKSRLCDITPEEIERFKRERASEKTKLGKLRSKATVNRDVAVLSAVFNLAKEFGELKDNPVNHVRYYTDLPTRERVLSEAEERILFDNIRDDVRFSNQVEILLYTGMRRGELFKLQWRDVDLEEGYINLRKETTKTNRARPLPMLSNVKAIFENLRREAGEIHPETIIFSGMDSQANTFSNHFTEICRALGIESLTVHSLRHTFSTRTDECSVGAFAQKALLGHSKLTMTDRYTHVSKESLKERIVPMEQYINRRNEGTNESDLRSSNVLKRKKL